MPKMDSIDVDKQPQESKPKKDAREVYANGKKGDEVGLVIDDQNANGELFEQSPSSTVKDL